jgi:hypothetical protein
MAFSVPSKSKAPQQAISLVPWLPSGIMRLAGAAPLVERSRQIASTRVKANDHSSKPA